MSNKVCSLCGTVHKPGENTLCDDVLPTKPTSVLEDYPHYWVVCKTRIIRLCGPTHWLDYWTGRGWNILPLNLQVSDFCHSKQITFEQAKQVANSNLVAGDTEPKSARDIALEILCLTDNCDVDATNKIESLITQHVAEVTKERDELKAEQVAIITGLRKEFTKGDLSGDILQDFAIFFEHHKLVESQLQSAREVIGEAEKALNEVTFDLESDEIKRDDALNSITDWQTKNPQ